jgi:hypothetical protein
MRISAASDQIPALRNKKDLPQSPLFWTTNRSIDAETAQLFGPCRHRIRNISCCGSETRTLRPQSRPPGARFFVLLN